ncbi:MAG: GNAT family N-acetyltransferase, partial [Nitrosomonas sp.]|nr:GNAT family N-acetyltransferase [Nitrosomonas sp.]
MQNSTHQEPIPLVTTTDTAKKWQCRWATAHDQEAFLSLFESAFGHAIPTSLWTWKYGHQTNYGVFAYIDNKIIAYYGGLPRQFSLNNKTLSAVQICDVMVAPNMRGILTRKGPFMLTAETFLSTQIGSNKPYQFAFGFPTERAAR